MPHQYLKGSLAACDSHMVPAGVLVALALVLVPLTTVAVHAHGMAATPHTSGHKGPATWALGIPVTAEPACCGWVNTVDVAVLTMDTCAGVVDNVAADVHHCGESVGVCRKGVD